MKNTHFTTFILLFILCLGTHAEVMASEKEVLKKADQLITERKYETAYDLLEKADGENKNPEIFLKKVDIALNYFIISMNHMIFNFQDLKEGENLLEVRGTKGDRKAYKLTIHETLSEYIKKEPKNWKYKRVLGYFLFDYFNKFERQVGEKADISFLTDSKKLLLEAYKHNECDVNSLNALGYFDYSEKKFDKAITYFKKSYKLNSEDMYTIYLLTACYFKTNKDDLAIKYGTIGLKLKNNQYALKADLAKMLGIIYKDKKDTKNAAKYFDMAEEYGKR